MRRSYVQLCDVICFAAKSEYYNISYRRTVRQANRAIEACNNVLSHLEHSSVVLFANRLAQLVEHRWSIELKRELKSNTELL